MIEKFIRASALPVLSVLIVIPLVFHSLARSEEKGEPFKVQKLIAVMDLQLGKGIDPEIKAMLTNSLINGLVKINKFKVIDRANRNKILEEQGLQSSDVCDDECRVQIGRVLGVGKIVTGSVDKIGETFIGMVQLVNVETGMIESSAQGKYKCQPEDLLDSMDLLAKSLMGAATPPAGEEKETKEAAPAPEKRPARTAEASASMPPLGAGHVMVLKSSDLSVYSEVVSRFQGYFPQAPVMTLPREESGLPDLLSKIQDENPRVILGIGPPALSFLSRKIRHLPIAHCMVFNPEQYSLLERNVSGIPLQVRVEDQLQIFKQALPSLRKIGVLYDPEINSANIAAARAAGKKLGLLLVERQVRKASEITTALKNIIYEVDALWMIPDSTVVSSDSFQYLLEYSIERKIPLLAFSEAYVKRGALLALAPDYQEIGILAGRLVRDILDGGIPGDARTVFSPGALVINMHTARTLNISIEPEVVRAAKRIY